MAYNEKLANRVRNAISHLPKVEEKKMFGGIAFMINEKMCITVGKDRIMCRIDTAIHDEAIKSKGIQSVIMRGREYKGYIHIKEDSIKTKKQFEYWIERALDFNKVAKASKKK